MALNFSKLQTSVKKAPKGEKMLYALALATLIATFLPWMSIPFFGSSYGGVSGFSSVGFLSFLGSLGYLLWKLLPMGGMSVPNFGMKDDMLNKVFAVLMLAGPVLWTVQSGFSFSYFGYGLWIALAASVGFAYFIFTGKKV